MKMCLLQFTVFLCNWYQFVKITKVIDKVNVVHFSFIVITFKNVTKEIAIFNRFLQTIFAS